MELDTLDLHVFGMLFVRFTRVSCGRRLLPLLLFYDQRRELSPTATARELGGAAVTTVANFRRRTGGVRLSLVACREQSDLTRKSGTKGKSVSGFSTLDYFALFLGMKRTVPASPRRTNMNETAKLINSEPAVDIFDGERYVEQPRRVQILMRRPPWRRFVRNGSESYAVAPL